MSVSAPLNLIGITHTGLHPHSHLLSPHPIHMPRFRSLGISTWEHNNRYSLLCDEYSECSRRRHSALFDVCSPFNRVIPAPPTSATTRIKITCIRPCSRDITPRQVVTHKCLSNPCALLNLLRTRIYSGIATLLCESQRTQKVVVPLTSLCIVLDDGIGLRMFLCVVGFPGTSCYLVCDFLLCAS